MSRIHVTRLTEHRIHQITVAVDGPVQIAPFAFHFHIRFIDIPAPADLTLSFPAETLGQQRSKSFLPLPNRFVGELESAQQIHLCQIPEAQFVPETAEHDFKDDIGGQFEEVEGRSGALVRFTPAPAAAERRVAEFGATVQLPKFGRLAVRADHWRKGGTSEYRPAPTSLGPES
jgi:hypothetical protein